MAGRVGSRAHAVSAGRGMGVGLQSTPVLRSPPAVPEPVPRVARLRVLRER
jgi:hypothetical protein